MKKISLLFLCYSTIWMAYSQDEPPSHAWASKASWFLPTEQISTTERKQYSQTLQTYCEKLKKQLKPKQDKKSLQKIFRQLHHTFLRTYRVNSSLAQTFRTGEFDCVSGTALFGLVLEYMEYAYTIHETATHVYLKVQTKQGQVLIETTNATQGFIKYTKEIGAIEQMYNSLLPKNVPPDFVPFNNTITLKELAGLQFYNQALFALQSENFEAGNILLRKAKMLYYHAPRVEKLLYLAKKL